MNWRISTVLFLAVVLLGEIPVADARITRLVITRVESPTFGGASFGAVGPFEKVVGVAYGEVYPSDPLNAIIQDIDLAPRNERGMVTYDTDFYILKPVDMTKGNRMLFYNVVNRGNKGGFTTFNLDASQPSNEPTGAGDGFLQKMGYTIVWSGWQPDVLPGNNRMTMRVPVAKNLDGSPITGIVRQEIVVNSPTVSTAINTSRFTSETTHTTYPTASTDNRTPFTDGFLPTLTVRTNPEDPREPIPNGDWSFASCSSGAPVTSALHLCYPGSFQPGRLYELIYKARDPIVMGLGYAAVRDLMAFFKHERKDDAGTPNPLWLPSARRGRGDNDDDDRGHSARRGRGDGDDDGRSALTAVFSGSSQSGRNMRTFIHLGFNEDEAGRIVFEGAYPHIGGGRALFNNRFSHAGRAWGQVFDQDYPAYEFPFSYKPTHDPLTGETNGILKRCLKTSTCPKIFHVATALEIWEGRQSLGLTDPLGRHDLREPGFVRAFIMVSTQHGSATPMAGSRGGPFGSCYQQSNPNPQRETMRALWKTFTDWVRDGVEPPPSTVPRLRDGTLVRPSEVNFPSIPANNYEGISRPAVTFLALANQLRVRDWGPLFNNEDESGIITVEPPEIVGTGRYAILVPQVDVDGNDLGGVRSTTERAPLGTYTGWNLGREGLWPNHLCSLTGSFIPFAETRAERMGVGDPRLSLEERYGNHAGYVAAVRKATVKLVRDRLLLPVDADRLISEADASDVLR